MSINTPVNSLPASDFEIRVGTFDDKSFNIGIKPPIIDDLDEREKVYDFLDTRPVRRSVALTVSADHESAYTDIFLNRCGPEEKDIAVIGIAWALISSGHTVKLNTKPIVHGDKMSDLFAE